MKSFFVRLGSSAFIVAFYVAAFLLRNTIGLNIMVALILFGAVFEMFKVTGFEERRGLYPFALVYALAVPFVTSPLILTLAFVVVTVVIALVQFEKADIFHLAFLSGMAVLICLSQYCLVELGDNLLLVLGASVCDVFCYLCGMLLGKHKLCPQISPKKTVEGSVGGVVFTVLAFVLYAFFTDKAMIFYGVLGVLVAVLSQVGDLFASVIKRTFDAKDYSDLIPGHGGVMDRIDSWLFTVPVIYLFLQLL